MRSKLDEISTNLRTRDARQMTFESPASLFEDA
jgi:hypothetical protein